MSFSVMLAILPSNCSVGLVIRIVLQRLMTTLRQVLECDASALLRYDSRQFIPSAIDGLAKDVLGRRFALEKVIHGWKRSPARVMRARFPDTANCPIPPRFDSRGRRV